MSTKVRSMSRVVIAILLLIVLILLVGVALSMVVSMQSSGDLLRDTVLTRAYGAGQTAMAEYDLTKQAR